jgi:hypothetical protein
MDLISLHVFSVNRSLGLCKVPASQLEEKELKAYRKIEQQEMNTLLNQYITYCKYLKVSKSVSLFLRSLQSFTSQSSYNFNS